MLAMASYEVSNTVTGFGSCSFSGCTGAGFGVHAQNPRSENIIVNSFSISEERSPVKPGMTLL
jgi:hypothetical protein